MWKSKSGFCSILACLQKTEPLLHLNATMSFFKTLILIFPFFSFFRVLDVDRCLVPRFYQLPLMDSHFYLIRANRDSCVKPILFLENASLFKSGLCASLLVKRITLDDWFYTGIILFLYKSNNGNVVPQPFFIVVFLFKSHIRATLKSFFSTGNL